MMMDDGRGGGGACCIAKYGGGGGYGEYVDVSKMHRVMLRFRPIAPKPSTAAGSSSSSGGSDPDVTSKPAPRRGRKRPRKAAKGMTSLVKSEERIVLTTLPLFPESPDGCGCSHDNGGGAAV